MLWLFLLLLLTGLFTFFDRRQAATTTLTLAILGAILLFSVHFSTKVGILL